jgi:hypothetical protein
MQYRIHLLDHGYHILESHDLTAPDDISALECGGGARPPNLVEIWQKRRLVARIDSTGEAVPDRPFVPSGGPYLDLVA